jgi:hypothetical protein
VSYRVFVEAFVQLPSPAPKAGPVRFVHSHRSAAAAAATSVAP